MRLALQRLTTEQNAGSRGDRRMEWRIGIHLGDVLVEGDDILGDGVNIAARLVIFGGRRFGIRYPLDHEFRATPRF
jgi:class 3 adenylate cyclase